MKEPYCDYCGSVFHFQDSCGALSGAAKERIARRDEIIRLLAEALDVCIKQYVKEPDEKNGWRAGMSDERMAWLVRVQAEAAA